jgi:hypothetical protein
MAIIDNTYFTGLIDIDYATTGISEKLAYFIDYVEKKYLKKLLGLTLYTEYIGNPTDDRFVKLIAGDATAVEYNGITFIYSGIKQMLAYFTYYHYCYDTQTINTGIGEIAIKHQNSEIALNINKMIRAYNEGIELYKESIAYMLSKGTYTNLDYQGLDEINSFGI